MGNGFEQDGLGPERVKAEEAVELEEEVEGTGGGSGGPNPSRAAVEGPGAEEDLTEEEQKAEPTLPVGRRRKQRGRRLVKKDVEPPRQLSPEQRLLALDTWKRSGLPAKDFASLVGVAKQTLYAWKKRFDSYGPAGLMGQKMGPRPGSKLPEYTKRTILMLKEGNPEFGCQRISDMLARGPGLGASAGAVNRVLKEAGYELEEVKTRPHRDKKRRFERARTNQLWQTDLFSFMLKRQNRRVYLVAFMDDHSRFLVGFGLHGSQSKDVVMETLRACLASYGAPEEILTDQGTQYHTWRGKSTFSKEMDKRGIKQIVARARHPQTLGKIERFWGTLWRECVETSVFLDLKDARKRIGLFIDHYNFRRPHQGIDGLVPADRFFNAAPEVLKTMKERVSENALQMAKNGVPKKPFYLTGQVGGKTVSVHAAGDRVIVSKEGEEVEEVDLVPPEPDEAEPMAPQGMQDMEGEPGSEEPAPPGVSVLDELVPVTEEEKA